MKYVRSMHAGMQCNVDYGVAMFGISIYIINLWCKWIRILEYLRIRKRMSLNFTDNKVTDNV